MTLTMKPVMKRTFHRTFHRTVIVLACAWLAGCASVPYHVPAMPLPAAYHEAQDGGAQGAQPDDAIAPDWWRAYNDATLDALLARIDVSNQSLLKSMALLRDARAQVDAARADYERIVVVSRETLLAAKRDIPES